MFVSPIAQMIAFGYALDNDLPTTYFIDLMRAIILRGANFFEYWPALGILSVMAVLLFSVCSLRFRKKIG
jgi:ABC-2 type transport system permease protein